MLSRDLPELCVPIFTGKIEPSHCAACLCSEALLFQFGFLGEDFYSSVLENSSHIHSCHQVNRTLPAYLILTGLPVGMAGNSGPVAFGLIDESAQFWTQAYSNVVLRIQIV